MCLHVSCTPGLLLVLACLPATFKAAPAHFCRLRLCYLLSDFSLKGQHQVLLLIPFAGYPGTFLDINAIGTTTLVP